MTYREALTQLHALYAQLPALACQGHCTDCCGPIGLSALEYRVMQRTTPLKLAETKTTTCPLLKRGRCTVYRQRPMVCRLWGCVESMSCPWGCRPERFLTVEEGDALMRQAEALSQAVLPGAAPCTMHPVDLIAQVEERGAKAVAWAVLATMEPVL